MIDSRRMASTTWSSACRPSSSGPRCTIVDAMRRTASMAARREAADVTVKPTMPHIRGVAPLRLRQLADDVRSEPVGCSQRQLAPGSHRETVLGVVRIHARQLAARRQPVMPVKLQRLGAPLALEAKGAAGQRRAAEIENPATAARCTLQ